MVVTLLTVSFLWFAPLADAPKPTPQLPFLDVSGQVGGQIVIQGKDFQATARRFTISADGKAIDLRGTDDEPARLVCRPDGPQTRMDVSGKRIVFSPSEGTVRVEGAGTIVLDEPKQK